ncbi:hypothetical protein [Streptomyces sp. SYSU K217416]
MRRRPAAASSAFLAGLLLTGCGIQDTDVIEAGGPATIQVFPHSPSGMVLFFRSPSGELMPVIRFLEGEAESPESPGASTPKTVAALFGGPVGNERKAGLTAGLPPLPEGGRIDEAPHPQGGVEVTLPIALADLDDTAVRQLVCTIAFTHDAEGTTGVGLRGTDGTLGHTNCDADADMGRLPRPTTQARQAYHVGSSRT